MLSNDQIRSVAEEIRRSADDRIHRTPDDRQADQFLWESVRHACHVVEAVAELERGELTGGDRVRRMQYVLSELETATEVARRARQAARWREREVEG